MKLLEKKKILPFNNFDLCWCCRFQRRPTPFSALPAQLITPRTVRLLPRPRPFLWRDRYRICPWPKRLWPQFSPRFPSHSILVNHPIITLGSPSYYCLFHQFCNCVANGFFGSEEVDRHWWQEWFADWQDGFHLPCVLFTWHIRIELVTKVLELSLLSFSKGPRDIFLTKLSHFSRFSSFQLIHIAITQL